jgi:hypothetical protein
VTIGVKPEPVLVAALFVALLTAAGRASEPRLLAILQGTEPSEHLGGWIAAAGDLNGDALADLLVGDSREGLYPGGRRCYLYHGQPVLDATPDLVIPQPEGEGDDLFGFFVAGACDVNGDGYDDALITSPRWFSWTGKIYLYCGGSPMDVEPDVAIEAWGSSWMTVLWATGLRGCLVRDVNGDGFDELACLVEVYTPDAGAYVYQGGSPMDSVHDWAFRCPEGEELELGSDIADGDLDGDGYLDLVVGAHGPDAAWVYLGGASTDTMPDVRLRASGVKWSYHLCVPGDLNGDGYDDVVVSHAWDAQQQIMYPKGFVFFGGSPMDSLPDLEFTGITYCGSNFELAGGDLNNDGFGDLIVGSTSFYYPEIARLAVYFGGADVDTIPDFEIVASDSFALRVAFLGDMTGDGWAEFAVSDPEGPGAIYIYTLAPEATGEDPPEARPIPALRLVPNPTRGPVSLLWDTADQTGLAELAVYDMEGHVVRRFPRRRASQVVCWDLRSTSGSPVSPGTYVIRLRSGQGTDQPGAEGTHSTRLVVTR